MDLQCREWLTKLHSDEILLSFKKNHTDIKKQYGRCS